MASKPIRIAIIGDSSQLKKVLKQTTKRLEGFGKSITKLGVASGVAFATTATAIATKGITAFADYEKGLKEVLTLTGDASAETFSKMSENVKAFAKETGVLPDKVLPALYQSISAGVPQDNVFEFLRVANAAAKGGIADLEVAVDALTSVTAAYSSTGMTAVEASDLLFSAVKSGKTDFNQLSSEIYKVAPIASAVGIEFKSVTAAMADLTLQGTPTAIAASQLKALFAELAKSGTKADTAFREFAGKGLTEFLAGGGSFQDALMLMKDGADEAGVSVLDLLGSIEGGQAVLALTADGGAHLAETMATMSNAAGATDAAFKIMDSSLSATFDRMRANVSVFFIEVGQKLAPLVERAVGQMVVAFEYLQPHIQRAKEIVQEWATEFAERMTPHVERFIEAAKKVIAWVRDFVRENPHPVLAALAVLVAAVVVPAIIGLAVAFASLFSPVIFIVAALAALAAGAVYAYENFEGFRNVVDTVRDWMVNTLWPALKVVAENIVIAFGAVVDFFQNDFVPIVQSVVATVIAVWQSVANFFMTYLWPTISLILGYIVQAFWAVLRFFQNDFVPIVQTVVAAVITAWQTVSSFFTETLLPIIQEVIGLIVDAFWGLVHFYNDDFLPAVMVVVDALIVAWEAVADFFMEYVFPIIEAAFIGIASVLDNFWDVVKAMVNLVKALFSGDFKEVWFKLRTMIGEVIDAVVDLFLFLPGRILAAAEPLLKVFNDIVQWFTVFLAQKILAVIQWLPDQIVEFLSGIATDILNLGKDIGGWIIDGLVSAIRAAAGAVADAVRAIIPDVGSIAGGVASSVGGWFKGLVPGLATGGIVTSPTLALIGEAGPEAVIPLDRLHGGGGSTFNITVNAGMGTDGRQVGNQIVSALKQWERSNGSLPLSVSAV